jgi:hypothetical protein
MRVLENWRKRLGNRPSWSAVVFLVVPTSALAGIGLWAILAHLPWAPLVTTALGSLIGAMVAVTFAERRGRKEAQAARRRRMRAAALDLLLLSSAASHVRQDLEQRALTEATLASIRGVSNLLERDREITDAVRELGNITLIGELAVRMGRARHLVDQFFEMESEKRWPELRRDPVRNDWIGVLCLVEEIAGRCMERLPPIDEMEA